jgi:hypothetical protein
MTSIFKGKSYHDRYEQSISHQQECARRVKNIKMQRQKKRQPVLLGLERTTSIEGTKKVCDSASAPGFAIIGASGGPDKTRLSTYQ